MGPDVVDNERLSKSAYVPWIGSVVLVTVVCLVLSWCTLDIAVSDSLLVLWWPSPRALYSESVEYIDDVGVYRRVLVNEISSESLETGLVLSYSGSGSGIITIIFLGG